MPCINRIRLEFKAYNEVWNRGELVVLIESDWNLKETAIIARWKPTFVLIESDWNLKYKADEYINVTTLY